MSEIADKPISELSKLIETRKLSPLELTEAYLERIERFNDQINGFVLVCKDEALSEARLAQEEIAAGRYKGPLHGIPIAHKDIYCTAGIRTTCCSEVLKDYVPSHDATVVSQWKNAGVTMLGKLNTHEYAYGTRNTTSYFGPARNPWDLSRHTGGSSGGSANSVLMALCAAATGSDSGGSIRMPSAATGVSGIKPTFGLGSRYGVFPLMWTMDHPGPMARTARDLALLLQPIAGYDPNDPTTVKRSYPDFSADIGRGIKGLTIGVPRRYFFDEADEEVERIVLESIDKMKRLGAKVVDVDLPHIEHAGTASGVLHLAEAAAYHDDVYSTSPELFQPETRKNLRMGQYILAKDYLHAQRYRELLGRSFEQAFRQVDFLATPTITILATRIEDDEVIIRGEKKSTHLSMLHNTEPLDLTGLPAVSVPCGFSKSGLPVGLQIIGRPFDESTILRAANAFQEATDWHLKRPQLPLSRS
jgi:aspartyl-tRNA(Asn)/glutamyl-tRNA(Gln) amidotransferase subunit A